MYHPPNSLIPASRADATVVPGDATLTLTLTITPAETIPAVNEVEAEGGGSSYGRPSALSAALGSSLGTSPADVRRRTYN